MGGNASAASNVVRLRPEKESGRASEKKWGKEVIAMGSCLVPSLLLRAQNRLGLNPTQLAVPMQLCDFWWDRDRKPYPGKAVLAERLGLGPRQVQRHIADLETAGLVKRVERRAIHGGKLSTSTTSAVWWRGRRSSNRISATWTRPPRRPSGRSPDGVSPNPHRRFGKIVMSGFGIETRTPGAYRVAEAGPECTR